jgi:CRP-like cAMP-binding protein
MSAIPASLPVDEPTAEAVNAAFKLEDFFPEFNAELCAKVFPRSGVVHYRAGEKLVEEGENGRDLFLILSGDVLVDFKAGHLAGAGVRLGYGSLIGEMALLADGVRSATVACSTPVFAFRLAFVDVGYILQNNPALAAHLKALESERTRR